MRSGARMPSEAESGRVLGEAGEGAHSQEASTGSTPGTQDCMSLRKLNASVRETAARAFLYWHNPPAF